MSDKNTQQKINIYFPASIGGLSLYDKKKDCVGRNTGGQVNS